MRPYRIVIIRKGVNHHAPTDIPIYNWPDPLYTKPRQTTII
jgi:hypothetical protein